VAAGKALEFSMQQLMRIALGMAVLGVAALVALAPAGSSRAELSEGAGSGPRACLADDDPSRPASIECELESMPEPLQLAVAHGADLWMGGGASSWHDIRAEHPSAVAPGLFGQAERSATWQTDVAARMRLAGRLRGFRYRAEYGLFHDAPEDRSIREGGRLLSSWSLGVFEPKLELSHRREQRLEPDADETTLSKARFSFNVRLPDLPILTLSGGRESKKVTPAWSRRKQANAEEVLTDVASATLWYGRDHWEAYATSSFFRIEQDMDQTSESMLHDHIFSLTYRPTAALSVVPLLEYSETHYSGSNYGTTSMVGSLGVYHTSFGGSLNSYLNASYLADRDSLGYLDTRSIDVSAGLEQDVSRLLGLAEGKQTLGLEFNVGRYEDLVYREASTTSYGLFLRLRVYP
jgi:hypothetical protein